VHILCLNLIAVYHIVTIASLVAWKHFRCWRVYITGSGTWRTHEMESGL